MAKGMLSDYSRKGCVIILVKVTDAVHEKGSFIFAQLRAYGRSANPEELRKEDPSFDYISASDVPLPDGPNPRPLTLGGTSDAMVIFLIRSHSIRV